MYGTQIYENIKINSRDPIFIMIHGGAGRENLVNTIYIYICVAYFRFSFYTCYTFFLGLIMGRINSMFLIKEFHN